MRSKASFKGHPIHPMLVGFPIAFFVGALVFDILGLINNAMSLWMVGRFLAVSGILMALIAAIPGIIDYIFTVPPQSSAKSRAAKHGLLNISVVALFTVSFIIRTDSISVLVIAIEMAGVLLLSAAGWMGGTLVHRNQIGVDPRYANAGKWKEAYFKSDNGTVEVAVADELQVNQMKLLHFHDQRVVLARTENGYTAFDDRCTHKGGSLAGGSMICGTVQCPWHGSQFDTHNGEVKAGPATEKIAVYPIFEEAGRIFIRLE